MQKLHLYVVISLFLLADLSPFTIARGDDNDGLSKNGTNDGHGEHLKGPMLIYIVENYFQKISLK